MTMAQRDKIIELHTAEHHHCTRTAAWNVMRFQVGRFRWEAWWGPDRPQHNNNRDPPGTNGHCYVSNHDPHTHVLSSMYCKKVRVDGMSFHSIKQAYTVAQARYAE